MSLFERDEFDAFIGGLRATEIVYQWGNASVSKVGGKIFAILSGWGQGDDLGISFKCSDTSFQMLPELSGVHPAPYLARAKWVQVQRVSELSEDDIAAYIKEAHRLVALKLPKKLQQELGLSADQ